MTGYFSRFSKSIPGVRAKPQAQVWAWPLAANW